MSEAALSRRTSRPENRLRRRGVYTTFHVSVAQTFPYRVMTRRLLLPLIVGLWVVACGAPSTSESPSRDLFFYVSADPQLNVPKWGLAGLDSMIATMNQAPGTAWPFGGTVGPPHGVLVPGDLVDDIGNSANWEAYQDHFDPAGEAQLRFPVYAGIGNHDLSDSTDLPFSSVEQATIRRHQQRPGPLNVGPEGYHYSWDWKGLHFVCLNIFPGNEPRPVYGTPAPWNDPKDALAFLKQDLAEQVDTSDQPIVLFWHYGLRGWGLEKWWTEADLANLKSTLAGYNVVLILHGHEHRYERYEWAGYDVVMAPAPYSPPDRAGAPSTPKGFLVVRATDDSLQLAHHAATGWKHTWAKPLKAKTDSTQETTAPAPLPER